MTRVPYWLIASSLVLLLLVTSWSEMAHAQVVSSLVSYWSMEGGSGASETDDHGSNDLTQNNTVGSTTGKVANARSFTASSSQYLSHASNSDLQTGDIDFSFSAWVFPSSGALTGIVVGKDVDTPGSSRDYTLALSGGTPSFYINGGGGGLIATWGASLSGSTWYHIAAGHSASANELWIVVNAGTPVTATTSGTAPQSSSAEFRIGARAYSGFVEYWDGDIDEVGFWKRDIRGDVSFLYNAGNGRSYADVVAGSSTGWPQGSQQLLIRGGEK